MSEALRKLKALVEAKQIAARIAKDGIKLNVPPEGQTGSKIPESFSPAPVVSSSTAFSYNSEQQRFIKLATEGHCVALTGPAGTGKTTATKGAITSLIQSGRVPLLNILNHKHLQSGTPGVVCVSFTNKAVQNVKKVLPHDLQKNCMTIHKLLEYQPVFYDEWDAKQGKYKKTMRFEPSWHDGHKLPKTLQVIIIDEAPMVPVSLWNRLFEALPWNPDLQVILIGDIQQLPPVFGKSIFIHAMQAGINKVELTEVYRQALESPIISLAHKILKGEIVPPPKLPELNVDKLAEGKGKVTIQPWKKALSPETALTVMGKFLPEMIDQGAYEPMDDVILCPFNKAFGTIELNKIVATHLASAKYNSAKEPIYEVIAGVNKKYFRVGDKVLYNKTEHTITEIKRNPKYFGKMPKPASLTLDYWGVEHDKAKNSALASLLEGSEEHINDIDNILNSFNLPGIDGEDKSALAQASSHIITVWSDDLESEEILESTGDVSSLDLGYAITVHKSQGSEYRRVFFITHQSHANMLFRELIYTGVTRAREELHIICPPSLLVAGITSQRLPGKDLEAKIAAFERYAQLNRGKTNEDEDPQGLSLFTPKGD